MSLPLVPESAPSGLVARALGRRRRRDRSRRALAVGLAAVAAVAWVGGGAVGPEHRQVTLVLYAPDAENVVVAGSWNAWESTHMSRTADGTFRAVVDLTPGSYEYQFRVDGHWVADPLATVTRADGFGSRNAVLHL